MNFEANFQNLTNILLAANSPDPKVRLPAENQINYFQEKDLPGFLQAVCAELGNAEKPANVRQLAGILLKNVLVARDPATQQRLNQRWLMMPAPVRAKLRENVLHVLASPLKEARGTAALVVTKIAAVEIPNGQWADLIPLLIQSIRSQNVDLQGGALTTLGYICEEIPTYLSSQSNHVLDAISHGMKADQQNAMIKIAATKALLHSLNFVRENMENEQHRNMIITMIFSAATCKHAQARLSAFECLVTIGDIYYDKIGQYMSEIFKLTHNAISKEEDDVRMMAIEFWSTIAVVETEILEETLDAQESNRQPSKVSQNFVNKALQLLAPLLMKCLTLQSDFSDEDTWDTAMAAGACLGLVSQCVRDNIVGHVLPFVQEHVNSKDWHYREAATLAFGSILQGPSKEKLVVLVGQAFPLILQHAKDPNSQVQDTAAWTIGRICDLLPQAIAPRILPTLMNTLLEGLKGEPKIAAHICWAIHNLAEAVHIAPNAPTSPLSSYFTGLVAGLLDVRSRNDVGEHNLLSGIYEAINVLVSSSALDVKVHVEKLIATYVEHLQKLLAIQGLQGAEKRRQHAEEALLAGSLAIVITKLDKETIIRHADGLMTLFLSLLNSDDAVVYEESLMAVGSLAIKIEEYFEKYMAAISPHLFAAIKNTQAFQVCQVAVNLAGDVCRSLGPKVAPHCDNIVALLLQNLQDPTMERGVKPHIISCIGDMALALGEHFERYLKFVMAILMHAAQTKFEVIDLSNIDYLNTLRESILDAYISILRGFSTDGKARVFLQYVQPAVVLIDHIVNDENRDHGVVNSACSLVGDLADTLGHEVKDVLRMPAVQQLLSIGAAMSVDKTAKTAQWASQNIQAL